jgi:hypothetical protein
MKSIKNFLNNKTMPVLLMFLMATGCTNSSNTFNYNADSTPIVNWSRIDSIDINEINSDLVKGKPTVDIGIYFPSNLDSTFTKVTFNKMIESFFFAKEIFKPTGVQLNLIFAKTGNINSSYLSIQANEVPGIPDTEYVNLYDNSRRHPSIPTNHAINAFRSIIEEDINNSRTIYLIALQDVFYPYLTLAEGRNWMMKTVRTGGLSFPSYSYIDQIPKDLRGIITITNLSTEDRYRKTIAHELGHKLINVSHEYNDINPGFEVFAEGGLMLYGSGEDIPTGKEGRWHLERLLLSPYLYKVDERGNKIWNNDYKEAGHYYDPIYDNYVIHFLPEPQINDDW